MKDLFDEYGNFVGRFEPSGGGFEGFFFLIGVVFLWAFGFLIYLFFKLIINGFKAMGRGEFGKALAYLIVPCVIVLLGTLSVVGVIAASAVDEMERRQAEQLRQQQISQELAEIEEKFPVTISNATRVSCQDGRVRGRCIEKDEIYILYTITNDWRSSIFFGEVGDGCSWTWKGLIDPFTEVMAVCRDWTTKLGENGTLLPKNERIPLRELCVGIELLTDGYGDILVGEELPIRTLCIDVPLRLNPPSP